MSSTFLLFLFFFLLICVVLFYIFTQKSLNDISNRLQRLQSATPTARTSDVIRRERAYFHDQLVLLEADISTTGREDLTEVEVVEIDKARKKIKICVDELKASGDWIGLPFDFEWTEILDRLPNVNNLYRKAIAEQIEAAQSTQIPAPAPAPAPEPAPAPKSRLSSPRR
jgi:hypothetical protein